MNPRRKPARPALPLTRERVLEAALQLVDRDGLDSLTMRSLGQALSVEAMSLYRYVSGKADLLAGVADLVLGEFELPPPSVEWRAGLKSVAQSVWRATERHPYVVPLLLRTPADTVRARRFAEGMIALIGRGGFAPGDAYQIYRFCQAYTLGSALMLQASPGAEDLRRLSRELRESGEFPLFAQAMAASGTIDRKADFDRGTEMVIAAIGLPRRRRRSRGG